MSTTTTGTADTTNNKGPVQIAMEDALGKDLSLAPLVHLELWNESYKHKGPKDAESHFKVILVSSQFEGKSLLGRHRLVNACLQSFLIAQEGNDQPPTVHALSIVAKTPTQWNEMQKRGEVVEPSPNCRGGDGSR